MMQRVLVMLVAAAATLAVARPDPKRVANPTRDPNMNGEYLLMKTPNAPGDFPTAFADYPGGVEYFDAYHGPITSLYSEVFWTSFSDALPQEIVDRFAGKAMAIVGIEMDQVRKTPEGDVSVPITMAYNHHHDTAIVGAKAHLEEMKLDRSDPRFGQYGRNFVRLDHGMAWVPVEDAPSDTGVAQSAMFSDGNGGEYRKSFHAYAPPFAQMVESPTTIAGSPMQIDTWNRDKMNLTGYPGFVPGPVPRHTLAPVSGPGAIYSGLLECPLTTRIKKVLGSGSKGFNDTFDAEVFQCGAAKVPQSCATKVATAAECFAAAKAIPALANATLTTSTVSSTSLPAGCSLSSNPASSSAAVVFNTNAGSTACCGASVAREVVGTLESLVHLTVNVSGGADVVTITMVGPSNVWFGVGFNANLMAEQPYAIIVDGVNGSVTERQLANQSPGTLLKPSVTVVSNSVAAGQRTVVLTRALKGASASHYTFNATALSVEMINAVGAGPTLAYHKARTAATLTLWPSGGAAACLCSVPAKPFGQGEGRILYLPTGEATGFDQHCEPQPREDILVQRNPTCDIRTYVGGLNVCHHKWNLLDADQEIPWADQPLTYYKKFRVYFQEYNASFHKQIQRNDWGIAADGDHAEYDVPQCAPGTATADCVHTITGTFTPITKPNVHLVSVHGHCHAPTCLSLNIYNNATGELICAQEPVYGGTGKIDQHRFDEPGYIATPPCLWGMEEHGLAPPPLISGVTMHIVAKTNATYGHHGEMALPEVTMVEL